MINTKLCERWIFLYSLIELLKSGSRVYQSSPSARIAGWLIFHPILLPLSLLCFRLLCLTEISLARDNYHKDVITEALMEFLLYTSFANHSSQKGCSQSWVHSFESVRCVDKSPWLRFTTIASIINRKFFSLMNPGWLSEVSSTSWIPPTEFAFSQSTGSEFRMHSESTQHHFTVFVMSVQFIQFNDSLLRSNCSIYSTHCE